MRRTDEMDKRVLKLFDQVGKAIRAAGDGTRRRPRKAARPKRSRDEVAVLQLCEASADEAENNPQGGLNHAELALLAAEDIEGEDCRNRAVSHCWAFISNARRAAKDFAGAEAALADAWRLRREKKPRGPEVFPEWPLHSFEASLRCDQQRIPEALACLDRAIALVAADHPAYLVLLRRKIRLTRTLLHGGKEDEAEEGRFEAFDLLGFDPFG